MLLIEDMPDKHIPYRCGSIKYQNIAILYNYGTCELWGVNNFYILLQLIYMIPILIVFISLKITILGLPKTISNMYTKNTSFIRLHQV